MKHFLLFLLIINSIYSQKKITQDIEQDDEPTIAEDRFRKREFEFGIRGGLGYKPDDKFESDLKNYKTESGTGVYGITELSSFNNTNHLEFFARMRAFSNSKFGFVYGTTKFQKFNLTEYTNAGYFTRLNFNLKTDFFFIMYHHEIRFRHFFIDLGAGMGINTITWQTGGGIYSRFGFSEQNGFMVGNGLGYRLESTLNRKINDFLIFQIGSFYNYYTTPYFNGAFNDGFGSYYVRSDGSVSALDNSEIQQSVYETNYASRKLDMRIGTVVLFAGIVLRVNF